MNQKTTGWVVFLAAVGMMFSLLAVDIVALNEFGEMRTPLFIGTLMGHIAAVITPFVGGRLIPEHRNGTERTRNGDV